MASSLVADYGSSASDSDSDNQQDREEHLPNDDENNSESENEDEESSGSFNQSEKSAVKLPRPDFAFSTNSSLNVKNSVFSNPFVEAENAKKAILEKHVKMTPTKDEIKMINGKKICWNFRKGRCRFGHNCKFAHDSDLQKTDEIANDNNCINANEQQQQQQQQVSKSSGAGAGAGAGTGAGATDDTFWDPETVRESKKKRPGLSQGLVPGKKVMKMYKKQQVKDTPWTISSKASV